MACTENPAPLAGGDRVGIQSCVTRDECHKAPQVATDLAAAFIATRYRIPKLLARLLCALARVGRVLQ
jgi:hypothetical protein